MLKYDPIYHWLVAIMNSYVLFIPKKQVPGLLNVRINAY